MEQQHLAANNKIVKQDNVREDVGNVFDLLPDELFTHLMTYVDLADLTNVGLFDVSYRFRRLCQSRRTKLVLNLSPEKEEEEGNDETTSRRTWSFLTRQGFRMSPGVAHVLSHCPKLVELEFQGSVLGAVMGDMVILALQHCPNLASLRGIYCSHNVNMVRDILKAIDEHGHSLKDLELRSVALGSEIPLDHFEALQGLTSITFLECLGLSDDSLRAMGESCKNITEFYLDTAYRKKIAKEAECHFIHGISGTIRKLKLCHYSPSKDFFEVLGKHCQYLEDFSVDQAENLDSSGLTLLFSLPNLKSLAIHNQSIHNEDFIGSFYGRKMEELIHLELSHCYELDDAALIIWVESCPNLEGLLLTNCLRLSDIGIRHVLLRCGKLRKLDLQGIFKVSRTTLEDISVHLPNLEQLVEPVYEGEEDEESDGDRDREDEHDSHRFREDNGGWDNVNNRDSDFVYCTDDWTDTY